MGLWSLDGADYMNMSMVSIIWECHPIVGSEKHKNDTSHMFLFNMLRSLSDKYLAKHPQVER